MITLTKLGALPRSQRFRKIAKQAEDAEHRLLLSGAVPSDEIIFLAGAARLAASDAELAVSVRDALCASAAVLEAPDTRRGSANPAATRRALNTLRRLLMAELGSFPADWDFDDESSLGGLDPSKRRAFPGMQVYLEDIRSPFNVGALFRSAESFGVEKIWLSPLCADPHHPRAQRTAMGCVDVLPWERCELSRFVASQSEMSQNITPRVFALETGGIPLDNFPFPPTGLMLIGSEELGLSPAALALADASLGRLSIPIYGAKGSINVSVAFGIAVQKWASYCMNRITEEHK